MTKQPSVAPHFDIVGKARRAAPAPTVPTAEKKQQDMFRTSVLFPRELHDALRRIAFEERTTVTDLVMEGLDIVLTRRGYPSTAQLGRKA